jgi:hypothetical protein
VRLFWSTRRGSNHGLAGEPSAQDHSAAAMAVLSLGAVALSLRHGDIPVWRSGFSPGRESAEAIRPAWKRLARP